MSKPSWLGKTKATRVNSEKQEVRLAKEMGGRKTANSGARFGENDVKTPDFDIEAKTTMSAQFILKVADLKKMQRKCSLNRIALFIIEFSEHGEEMVLINKADFFSLIEKNKQ